MPRNDMTLCETCDKRIWKHWLRGHIAYCDSDRQTRSPNLEAPEILQVRQILGQSVSDRLRNRAAKIERTRGVVA